MDIYHRATTPLVKLVETNTRQSFSHVIFLVKNFKSDEDTHKKNPIPRAPIVYLRHDCFGWSKRLKKNKPRSLMNHEVAMSPTSNKVVLILN